MTIPLYLDQANDRICEFESGVQQIDAEFIPTDPDVAIAQAAADAAQADATQALADAAAAQATANGAQTDATQALADAATSQATALAASVAASDAQADADQALLDAASAQGTANGAAADVITAQAAADAAQIAATNAQNDATQALADAATAQSTANAAAATAAAALSAANAAQADATQALSDAAAALVVAQNRLISVQPGTNITVDNTDPLNPVVNSTVSGGVQSVTAPAGNQVTVDNTDPLNPVVQWAFPTYLYEQELTPEVNFTSPSSLEIDQTGTTFPGTPFMTLTTGVLPAGTYQLEWSYYWALDTTGSDFLARIEETSTVNGLSIYGFHIQEAKDSAGGTGQGGITGAGTNQRHSASGFREVIMDGNESITFGLRHAPSLNGVEATIGEGYMKLIRVS